jgi:hypothetical protein
MYLDQRVLIAALPPIEESADAHDLVTLLRADLGPYGIVELHHADVYNVAEVRVAASPAGEPAGAWVRLVLEPCEARRTEPPPVGSPAVAFVTVTLPRSIKVPTFSNGINARMHALLELNTEGKLSDSDRADLESLVQMSQFATIIWLALQQRLGEVRIERVIP